MVFCPVCGIKRGSEPYEVIEHWCGSCNLTYRVLKRGNKKHKDDIHG